MRQASYTRRTSETDIVLSLDLDGVGEYEIDTGCGFLDHMLSALSRHSGIDLTLRCKGDLETGYHHTVEDCGIALGTTMRKALGDRSGIRRFGDCALPMDEALVLAAVDISGRAACVCELNTPSQRIGDFDTELLEEFFIAFSRGLGAAIHLHKLAGKNSHHIAEAGFKALARALSDAVAPDEKNAGRAPSTKGMLD